ncbi:hypothetical protein GSI_12442 [Ganoderma sinense ZZ0214-1]|uniref:Fungal-type protein kinase domain-containing protein n=1 Tax=Ganoderma sinense ZZ0214-1 TaxID=1077348 RepID=A0A2G8RT76_9APHY|nr:hypothetical protein GSI_12442 [Ganoderma sinense ZZ0214-1]
MGGEFEVSSLKNLLNLWLDNRLTMSGLDSTFSAAFTHYSALAINVLGRQNLSNARWNVEVAYNTSNAFYQCFLSKEMMYSCAIWGEEEHGVRGDLTVGPTAGDLEAAQCRKIHNILTKARVHAGDRLLEIGLSWGAMAIEVLLPQAALLGCTVDTVTLSREQMEMVVQRSLEAGVSDRVRVHLCDYHDMPASFEHAFDAVVTTEMIEAVGPRYMHQFFQCMDRALKPDKATMVITATSQPEFRYTDYQYMPNHGITGHSRGDHGNPEDNCNDVGIYPTTEMARCITHFIKRGVTWSRRKQEVEESSFGRRSWYWMAVLGQVKSETNRTCAFNMVPDALLPPDAAEAAEPYITGDEQGEEGLGQLAEYMHNLLTHQHRCFAYGFYVQGKYARLLYFDRTGALLSEAFDWSEPTSLLHDFVWKVAHMTPEQLGYDPSAQVASESDLDLLRSKMACSELETLPAEVQQYVLRRSGT